MPIQTCQIKGKTAYRWGRSGKCYRSRERALEQMRAVLATGWTENYDPDQPRDEKGMWSSYTVGIHKVYFPKSMHPKGVGQELVHQVVIKAASREEAAKKYWGKYGTGHLLAMNPWNSKLPRKVSVHVGKQGSVTASMGRLSPILVYTGTEPTSNVFCPTGPGGGVDPSCSPVGDSKAYGDLRPESKSLLGSARTWKKLKPWNMSAGDISSGMVPGVYYEPNLGNEASNMSGKIALGPKFFQMKYEESRKSVLYHELGHELADSLVQDGTIWKMIDSGKMPAEYDGQTLGHEILAQAYATVHTDPQYLHKHAPEIERVVKQRAAELRMPTTNAAAKAGKTRNLLKLDPSRTLTLRRRFMSELKRRFNLLKGDLRKLIVKEDAFGLRPVPHFTSNVFCPTGPGGGVDPTCSPGEGGGGSSGGVTGSKEFKSWFGKSKVTDASGKPIVVYHGSLHEFDQFRTEGKEDWDLTDRAIGAHFAEDPSVTETFSVGEYAYQQDAHVSDDPERSWYRNRETREIEYDKGIPLLVTKGADGNPVSVPYDPKVHGSSWGMRERHGEGAELRMVPPGGHTQAVFLSIKNPLVVVPSDKEFDQNAISRAIGSKVFPADRQLFVDANKHSGAFKDKAAGEMWDTFHEGKSYQYGSTPEQTYHSMKDFIRDRGSTMLNGKELTGRAKAVLEKQGYDGIRYSNTSPSEVKTGKNPWAWIAFRPEQIKSAIGNRGTFNPKDPIITHSLTRNARFAFNTTPEKIAAFRKWLAAQVQYRILGTMSDQIENAWWERYIKEGFQKGAGRAFDDTKKPYARGYAKDESTKDFYRGSKYEFLRSSFGQPESVAKVKLLASRTYTDLKGVTDSMSTRLTRTLTDGLVQGRNPSDIARSIVSDVEGIDQSRALAIARTEIIRSHAEGQLDAFDMLGVTAVGVAAEWATAEDDRVCEECDSLSGVVMSVDEARGLLPRHTNCRCSWLPANVGEDEEDQKRTRSEITKAIDASYRAEMPTQTKRTLAEQKERSSWGGADKTISRVRPELGVEPEEE